MDIRSNERLRSKVVAYVALEKGSGDSVARDPERFTWVGHGRWTYDEGIQSRGESNVQRRIEEPDCLSFC